jgi:hypothetical protein
MNKSCFVMSAYLICFSVIKSCVYWNPVTLDAINEQAKLFYNSLVQNDASELPNTYNKYI